jgi:hypothetical protein
LFISHFGYIHRYTAPILHTQFPGLSSHILLPLLVKRPSNHHPPDLTCPRANLIKFRVPQYPADRNLIHIPHAAHQLHRICRNLARTLRRIQNRASTVLRAHFGVRMRFIDGARNAVCEGLGGAEFGVHVSELALDQLVVCDRCAELFALVGVREDDVERSLHEAERACGEDEALEIETFHEDADAAVQVSQHVFFGHEDVVEDEFACVGAAHAELVEFLGDAEAFGGGFDDEGGYAFGGGGGLGFGVDDDCVCVWALSHTLAFIRLGIGEKVKVRL